MKNFNCHLFLLINIYRKAHQTIEKKTTQPAGTASGWIMLALSSSGRDVWKETFPLKSLDLWLQLGNPGPFSTAHIQQNCAERWTARKCLQIRAFPLEGKREQAAQKTGAEARICQKLIWGVSFPVSEPEQSQAMQRCSKWSRWCCLQLNYDSSQQRSTSTGFWQNTSKSPRLSGLPKSPAQRLMKKPLKSSNLTVTGSHSPLWKCQCPACIKEFTEDFL